MANIQIIQGDFEQKLKLQFAPGIKAEGITGSVLLIIFRSLISLCFITCLIRISFNLKKDQKNRPHDPPRWSDIIVLK